MRHIELPQTHQTVHTHNFQTHEVTLLKTKH